MIHQSVKIHPTAQIDCNFIEIGPGGVIGAGCIIKGYDIRIGHELWMDTGSMIGGGSCYDPCAFLKAGDWLHMGKNSQINIARGVTMGSEVGLGIQTQVFTHGAYLNELNGFPSQFDPVTIGDNVWLPNAWVNPGVNIGSNVVVAAQSLINKDLPAGCLAAGSPAKVLKEDFYPRMLNVEKQTRILNNVLEECKTILSKDVGTVLGLSILAENTVFDCKDYVIKGPVTEKSEVVRNQLRRHGIRFRYYVKNNTYKRWKINEVQY